MSKATTFAGFDQESLKAAFDAVCNKQDWKAPIQCTVTAEKMSITLAAIEFFTATSPLFWVKSVNGRPQTVTIHSIGYRLGPAGDH